MIDTKKIKIEQKAVFNLLIFIDFNQSPFSRQRNHHELGQKVYKICVTKSISLSCNPQASETSSSDECTLHGYLSVYTIASFPLTLNRQSAVKLDNLCSYDRVTAHHKGVYPISWSCRLHSGATHRSAQAIRQTADRALKKKGDANANGTYCTEYV